MIGHMCCRYVWAHRLPLARSVHDMAKQMYSNKKYSDVAWQPLKVWMFDCEEKLSEKRSNHLTKFNRDSTEFFDIVALCLWRLANGSNMPWGRSATQPDVFVSIPAYEKVRAFFFCHLKITYSYMGSTSRICCGFPI